jgi:hypothetical protein
MVIVKADKDSETGLLPTKKTKETFAAMGKFNEELVRAGVMLAGEGLQPSSKGKASPAFGKAAHGDRRTFRRNQGTHRRLLAVAGEVHGRSGRMAQACPVRRGAEVEIRQVYEVSDFPADVLPPEDAAREQALRDELQKKAAKR